MFEPSHCIIKDPTSDKITLTAKRHDSTYVLYLDDLLDQTVKCLASFVNKKWMWHKKLGHAYMRLIFEIVQKELAKGLPKISFDNDLIFEFYKGAKRLRECSVNY